MTTIEDVYGQSAESLVAAGKTRWERQKAAALAKAKAEGKEPYQMLDFSPSPEEVDAAHDEPVADESDVKESETASA